MLLLAHPPLSYSQNSTSCDDKLATAKRIAQDAIDNAKVAEAREAQMRKQRDQALDDVETCQTDRDHAAKGEADCKTRNIDLEAKVAPLVVDNTLLKAGLSKQKRLTKTWTIAGLVVGALLGAAAGGYVVARASN